MILYDKDWNIYPDAIIHHSTPNKSFLEYSALLDKMGVHNSAWPLTLLNPDLEFVDPYSHNLSPETKLAIALECSENPWYVVREIIRIPPTSGDGVIPFKANRGNMAMLWSYYAGITYAAIQPRQTGKSVGADVISVINLVFLCYNTEMLLVTKDEKLLSRNIRRIKSLMRLLPDYLYPVSRNDADNNERITVTARNNYLIGLIAQKDRKAANNQGRGMTASHIQYDEPPFCANVSEIIPAATSASARARDNARMNGEPYGILYTTTAGDIDDPEARFVYDIIFSGAFMDERAFYDSYDYSDLRERVLSNGSSKAPLINGTFSHRQLGFSDEWLYDAITESRGSKFKTDVDFFNRWKSAKQSDLIPVDIQASITEHSQEPVYLDITRDKKIINWYIAQDELEGMVRTGDSIILGLDTSDSINRDAIAGIFTHATSGKLLGRFTVNDDNLHNFASTFLLDLMVKYSNVVLVPEMKSSARGIIDALASGMILKDINPFKRIYNKIVQNSSDSSLAKSRYDELKNKLYVDINYFNNRRADFGFITSNSTRTTLYESILFKSIKALAPYIRDNKLISELISLSEKRGRIDHGSSGHDDHVIAWLLTQWLRYEGRNLDFYGIESIDTSVSWIPKEETMEDLVDDIRDVGIRNTIDTLRRKLADCDDPSLIAIGEAQIRRLYSQLSQPARYGSVDEIMKSIESSRDVRSAARNLEFGDIWAGIR